VSEPTSPSRYLWLVLAGFVVMLAILLVGYELVRLFAWLP
jgi:hypothetical protein